MIRKIFTPLPVVAALWSVQAVATEDHVMEHVLVTMPAHRKDAQTALPVTVLRGEELRRRAASTLGDTLQQEPGLSSASFGPGVGQPVIRGQQGPRVQVLQNSLPSFDVSTNSADHAVSVEPLLADSVEVIRGPATLLYGSGAIGGVVNVLDNRVPATHVQGVEGGLELRHSSVDDGRTGTMRIDAGNGPWAFHLNGLYRDWNEPDIPGLAIDPSAVEEIEENSDGYIANADGVARRFTLGSAYHFDRGYVGVSYSEYQDEYGIPGGVHAHHDEEHEGEEEHEEELDEHDEHEEEGGISLDVEQTRWDLAGDLHLEGFWELFRWRAAYSDYSHVEVEPSGEAGTRFEKEATALRGEWAHAPRGAWHGVLGLQFQQSDFSAIGEEAFVPANTTQAVGLFWVEDYHGDGWQIESGLRVDLTELEANESALDDHDDTVFSASVAGRIDLTSALTASLALSQSSRAATAEERYSNVLNDEASWVVHGATGAIELGDQSLDTETSRNLDAGLEFVSQLGGAQVSAELNLFYNAFADFIYLDNTGEVHDESPVLSYAQQDAEFVGLEYRLGMVKPVADGELGLTVFGDAIEGELDDGENVPRMPPHRVGLTASWTLGAWYADITVIRAAKQNQPGQFESETDGYTRVDAGVSWQLSMAEVEHTLSLQGKNLGDETIRRSTSFIRDYAPEPGRNIELAWRVQF